MVRTKLFDYALEEDEEEMIDWLKDPENKKQIDEPDAVGWTALHWACAKGLFNSVRILVDHGANVNMGTEQDGWTAAHDAARGGHTEILAKLKEAGANVDAASSSGTRPLQYAVQYNQGRACELLVGEGCDVNTANNLGWTPLHFAARYCRLGIAKDLVSKGAVAYFPDKIGRSPQTLVKELKEKVLKGHVKLEGDQKLDDWDALTELLEIATDTQKSEAREIAEHAVENALVSADSHDLYGALEHYTVAMQHFKLAQMEAEEKECAEKIEKLETNIKVSRDLAAKPGSPLRRAHGSPHK